MGKDFDRRNMKDMKNRPEKREVFPSSSSCLSCLIQPAFNPVNLVNPV
jgi:hypothetical protein